MSFIFKWLTNFFFSEVEDEEYETRDCELLFENEKSIEVSLSPDKIIRRKGIITLVNEEYGLIDNNWYFDVSVAPKLRKLIVGESVNYKAYKANDREAERIIQIDEVDEAFEDETREWQEKKNVVVTSKVEDESLLESTERVLNGNISVKQGDDVFIHPLNIHCNLENVRCDFIPIEGDWVSVVAEVSSDSDAFNLAGEILHIKCLKPLLLRKGIGTVTYINDNRGKGCKGVIENEIYFSTDFCQIDSRFTFGEQVSYMAIESDQGKYKWRALSIKGTTEAEAGDRSSETLNLIKDKSGIKIDGKLKFGPLEIGQTEETKLLIQNNGKTKRLIKNLFFSRKKRSQVALKKPDNSLEILIEPGKSVEFVFECTAKYLGFSSEIFVFHFDNFKMGRRFEVNVVPEGDLKTLISCQGNGEDDDVSRKRIFLWKNFDLTNALHGQRPAQKLRFSSGRKPSFDNYSVPDDLFKVFLGEVGSNGLNPVKTRVLAYAPCLKGDLNESNYKEKFHTLLYLEEIQNKITFRKYDIHGAILRKRNNYLALDVSHISNNETIFMLGTPVVVTQPWSEVNTGKQVGYVQENRDGILLVLFHESFHASYDESDCDVFFQPIRTTFIRCHIAVDLAVKRLGMNWLFPKSLREKPSALNGESSKPRDSNDDLSLADLQCEIDENGYVIPKNDAPAENPVEEVSIRQSDYNLKWFNQNLNDQQRAAVGNVMEGKCRPLPYVIFGPPGTGKTITIVEVILQVYTTISDSRILIGTPSNSAADIICHYLISTGKFTPGELVRLLARNRAASGDVPENIVPYCSTITDDNPLDPKERNPHSIRFHNSADCIGMQRIVISTCAAVGLLHTLGLNQGHFSHIIVDEAGQLFEPEILIPISFLDPKRGQVILSGDTEQLGPISVGFRDDLFDLSRSFLERISKLPPYIRNHTLFPHTRGFDPRCVTRLRVNYRSVPEILNLPSQLFYDSELIATVSHESGSEAEIIRRFNFESDKRDMPPAIIFHAIRGQTYQEKYNPSFYNPLEMWQCILYLKRLYSIDLTPEDVGIITPYQKQVEKLRSLLLALNVPIPKIGSVEEFQGQERYAIILSTVRSHKAVEDSGSRSLGFLASPRRINVAITRARAVLIIVGNPYTLRVDPYWSAVIQYCIDNNSCTGCLFENSFPNAKGDDND